MTINAARSWLRPTFRSLAQPNFRRFAIGQLISKTGMWMQTVTVAIVVLDVTNSGFAVGAVTAALYVPVLLLSAWAGVWSDRCDRHRTLVSLNVYGLVVAAGWAVLISSDQVGLVPIFVLATLNGIYTALENPMRRVFIADLVAERDVPNAVGLNSMLTTSSRVVGPLVAGALIAGPGLAWCFIANALSFVPQIVLFLRMDRGAFRPSPKLVRAAGQLRAGLQYAWADPTLRVSIVLVAVVGTLAYNFSVVLPLLAIRVLGGGPSTYTVLYATMSAGAIVGALLFARRDDVSIRYLGWSSLGFGAAMTMLAVAPSVGFAYMVAIPLGIASVLLISASNAIVQARARPEMRGRVLSFLSVVVIGSTAIGGPITGGVAELWNARVAVGLGAAAALTGGALTVLATSRTGTTPAVTAPEGTADVTIA